MFVIKTELVILNDKVEIKLLALSVCCSVPVVASQTLTILSYDTDASSFELCEKAIELTLSLCPSSVYKSAFYSRSVFGSYKIQSSI
jgi:hypothetical protein